MIDGKDRYNTKYTNNSGKVIPAIAEIEYINRTNTSEPGAPVDTLVYLLPQVRGAGYHKIKLSGPNSKYYKFDNSDGTFYPNIKYEDYYIEKAREAVKNAKPRSFKEDIVQGLKNLFSFKNGGNLNKYQQGGAAPQQDIQQQVRLLVQAVAQGNKEAAAQIQQIVNAAQQGDQNAIWLLQLIQQEALALQMAKRGAKLNYLKSLKGDCPEGEELVYFRKGGNICKKCEKKKQESLKNSNKLITEFKKGKPMKKC